jgi:hypothetical protein
VSSRDPALAGGAAAVALATAAAGLVAATRLTAGVAAVAGVAAAVLLLARVAAEYSTVARVACSACGAAGLWVAVGLAAVAPLPLRSRGPLTVTVLGVGLVAFAVAPVRRGWTRGLADAALAAMLAGGLARSVLTPVPVWYPAVVTWVAVLAWDAATVAAAIGRRAPPGPGPRRAVVRHLAGSVGVGGAAVTATVLGHAALPSLDSTLGVAALVAAATVAIGVLAVGR